jgi:hypothetical protein
MSWAAASATTWSEWRGPGAGVAARWCGAGRPVWRRDERGPVVLRDAVRDGWNGDAGANAHRVSGDPTL